MSRMEEKNKNIWKNICDTVDSEGIVFVHIHKLWGWFK